MAKKVKEEVAQKANFKPRQKPVNGRKFTKGFVKAGELNKFFFWGTKKIVLKMPVPQKG